MLKINEKAKISKIKLANKQHKAQAKLKLKAEKTAMAEVQKQEAISGLKFN